jgi:acetyl esterase/lipase
MVAHVTSVKRQYPFTVRTFLTLLAACLCVAGPLSAQQVTMPLWPQGVPEVTKMPAPEHDSTGPNGALVAGRPVIRLTDVSEPTLSVYKPEGQNTGVAVLVFPGGGYGVLAYDLEGTEACTWLNSIGVTCVLVKYRVPYGGHYPQRLEDFEDAQRAMRITREHAAEWKINPHRIGVLGFSAGAHLAVVLSIHAEQKTYTPVDPADALEAKPNFALIIYPGYLADAPTLTKTADGIDPDATTPPTFLVQAENDGVHVENALVYFQALKAVKVPAELHIFDQGGHGYGLRPTYMPITHWPALAETWLQTIHMIPPPAK